MIPDSFLQSASEGGPTDAVRGDLSDGAAHPDAVGIRNGELESIGALPTLWDLPGYVLRMAQPEGVRRSGMVQGPLACAAALFADDCRSDRREGDRGEATFSLSGPPQAACGARARSAGDGLACGLDHRRASQASRFGGSHQASPPTA